jgi:membrane protein DedA with SNARE-associated domain
MEALVGYLIEYGYWILLAWVLLDQLLMPIPALPMILAAGGLAGEGYLNLGVCGAIVVFACMLPNFLWYWMGKHHGNKVLTLLCTVSLEPDSCVDNTTSLFHRHGTASLLFSKFVPGLQTVAPPLAGLLGISAWRFAMLNGAGSLLYAVAFLLPGYLAHEFLAETTRVVSEFGSIAGAAIVVLVVAWLAWKVVHRQRFLRKLRGLRVQPSDLSAQLSAGETVQIADLRQRMEFNAFPQTIPGAIRVPLDLFDERIAQLTKERPLVLFCT